MYSLLVPFSFPLGYEINSGWFVRVCVLVAFLCWCRTFTSHVLEFTDHVPYPYIWRVWYLRSRIDTCVMYLWKLQCWVLLYLVFILTVSGMQVSSSSVQVIIDTMLQWKSMVVCGCMWWSYGHHWICIHACTFMYAGSHPRPKAIWRQDYLYFCNYNNIVMSVCTLTSFTLLLFLRPRWYRQQWIYWNRPCDFPDSS